MDAFFVKVKNFALQKQFLLKLIPLFLIIVVILQNKALLFNPLIIALISTLYLFPLTYQTIFIISSSITGFAISYYYGLEILILGISTIMINLVLKRLKDNLKPFIICSILCSTMFFIYFFTDTSYAARMNAILNLFASLLLSLLLSFLYLKIKKEEAINDLYYGFGIFFVSLCFANIEEICILWITLFLCVSIKIKRNVSVMMTIFPILLSLYLFNNYPIELLFTVFTGIFITALLPYYRFNLVLNVIITSILFYVYNKEFYLSQQYYQVIIGTVLPLFIPENIINKKEEKCENIPIEKNKLNHIYELCTLLEDKRFEKYTSLDRVLENDIKKSICLTCNRNKECNLIDESSIKNYIDENKKKKISSNCLYPYQIIKKISAHNQRYYDFNNLELEMAKCKDIMCKPYSLIKNIIDSNVYTNNLNSNYTAEVECISIGISAENGDYNDQFEYNGSHYVLLSDGMGHDKSSNEISSYLVSLSKLFILNGCELYSGIKDVNDIMLSKTNEEIYATLDIAKFDLTNGKLLLYKAGSYSTFLLRQKIVQEYPPLLPPIGIVSNIKDKYNLIELERNDIIIFMTDGFGEDVETIISSSWQKAKFLSLKNYIKYLYNRMNKEIKCDDDKTIIGVKIR